MPLCDEHARLAADVRGLALRMATRTGQEEARSKGVHIGRPRAISDAILDELRRLRSSGLSYRTVAREMNEAGHKGPHGGNWHESSVRAALRRYGSS